MGQELDHFQASSSSGSSSSGSSSSSSSSSSTRRRSLTTSRPPHRKQRPRTWPAPSSASTLPVGGASEPWPGLSLILGTLTHGPPPLTCQVAGRMLHKEAFSVATLETMNDANIRTRPSFDLRTLAAATLCTQTATPRTLHPDCIPTLPGTNVTLLRPLGANHLGEMDVFDDYPVPADQRMWDGLCRRTVTLPACRRHSALPRPPGDGWMDGSLGSWRRHAFGGEPEGPRGGRCCGAAARPGQRCRYRCARLCR